MKICNAVIECVFRIDSIWCNSFSKNGQSFKVLSAGIEDIKKDPKKESDALSALINIMKASVLASDKNKQGEHYLEKILKMNLSANLIKMIKINEII
mgnify:CR=1 FL=1